MASAMGGSRRNPMREPETDSAETPVAGDDQKAGIYFSWEDGSVMLGLRAVQVYGSLRIRDAAGDRPGCSGDSLLLVSGTSALELQTGPWLQTWQSWLDR
jgi:hypothetical protein